MKRIMKLRLNYRMLLDIILNNLKSLLMKKFEEEDLRDMLISLIVDVSLDRNTSFMGCFFIGVRLYIIEKAHCSLMFC